MVALLENRLCFPLIGRDKELAEVMDAATALDGGSVVVVRGPVGSGKSALLDAAEEAAVAHGHQVLRANGSRAEHELPYAALHQLLRPAMSQLGELPVRQQRALSATFAMDDSQPQDKFAVALAAFGLIHSLAAQRRLWLVVDQSQWLDTASQEVLCFVMRRAIDTPITLLMATGMSAGQIEQTTHHRIDLTPLDYHAAQELACSVAPELETSIRDRLLDEAGGNPLVVIELCKSASSHDVATRQIRPPLSGPVLRSFAACLNDLAEPTRKLLLVAALNDGTSLDEILAAASRLTGGDVTVDALKPAVAAGIAAVTDADVHLLPSVWHRIIVEASSDRERRCAHMALAEVLTSYQDRAIPHLASATSMPDDALADRLQTVSDRALARGDYGSAARSCERAAALTDNETERSIRLVKAAELWMELEQHDRTQRLLAEVEVLESAPSSVTTTAKWLTNHGQLLTAAMAGEVGPALELVNELRASGACECAMRALNMTAQLCWVTGLDSAAREQVIDCARSMPVGIDHPLYLSTLALAAPVESAATVIAHLPPPSLAILSDPDMSYQLGVAALLSGAGSVAAPFIGASVSGFRAQQRRSRLAAALQLQAYDGLWSGQWELARRSADEAISIATDTGNLMTAAASQGAQALLAAMRGDEGAVERITEEMDRVFLPLGANSMLALARASRGIVALGAGQPLVALDHLRRVYDKDDTAYDDAVGHWVLADYVEAAVRSDEVEHARAVVGKFERSALFSNSPLALAGLARARALTAEPEEADGAFKCALEGPLSDFPFMTARTLLDYGAWLRRQRRKLECRRPFRTATETFDALGAEAWAAKARQELRASGETNRRRLPEARDQLSPQELQIAELAATGLTNRAIGDRLFVSSRTVGSHLYRIFPKLGISSRSELAHALGSLGDLSRQLDTAIDTQLGVDVREVHLHGAA
jgi:DNA-binding CsgD family transcriptional regulator